MSQTKSPPPLDGADGPRERHRRDAFDGRKNSHPDHVPQARNKARFQLLVSKLHALGRYPFYHFIDEIERGADVRDLLEIYASLPPGFIKAYGGDVFPPSVHFIVGEGAEG